MEPITDGIALAGLLLNGSNMFNAQDNAANNLAFQREQAAKQERLSTASRTDAFGNTLRYDPATNSWVTDLTPMQKAIQDASQSEQLQSLTTDAQRNRSARKAAYDESMAALPVLNKAIAGFQYDQPASEAADRDKLTSLMIQANQDKNLGTRSLLATEAARMGNEKNIPALFKASADQAGSDLPDTLLKAYTAAKQQRQGEVAAHNNQYLPQIQGLEGIVANNGSGAAVNPSNISSMLNALQSQMAQGGLTALTSGSSGINAASNALTTSLGKQLDVSSLIKALQGNNKTSKVNNDGTTGTASATGSVDASNAWDSNIPWTTAPDYLDNINFSF